MTAVDILKVSVIFFCSPALSCGKVWLYWCAPLCKIVKPSGRVKFTLTFLADTPPLFFINKVIVKFWPGLITHGGGGLNSNLSSVWLGEFFQ